MPRSLVNLVDEIGLDARIGTLEGAASVVKNYITNPTASTNTTGWATYADAAGTAPVDGTGGSPSVTFTRSTTTPLRGLADFNFTKDAANRQGEGVATDITIDLADQAKVLTVNFDYEVLSGTYATGDLTVYLIADPTGTPVVIQPAGYQVQAATAGTKMRQIATFQTQVTGQSYRVCFHVASTSASAYALAVDNVVVGPQTVQYGAPVTDWQSYSVTIFGSISNPTEGAGSVKTAYWRRVGDSLEVLFNYVQTVAGTTGSGDYQFNIPSGLTIDTSKFAASTTGFGLATSIAGHGQLFDGTNAYDVAVLLASSTRFIIVPTGFPNAVGSATFTLATAARRYVFSAKVPILGWSSTVQMSNDTDTRVVAMQSRTSNTSVANSYTNVIYSSVVSDSHAQYNATTGIYTVPVSGWYRVSAGISFGALAWGAGAQTSLLVRRDSTQLYESFGTVNVVADTATTTKFAQGSWQVYCTAGQTLNIQGRQTQTGAVSLNNDSAQNFFHVERLSGPSAIAASETVAFGTLSQTPTGTISGAAFNNVIFGTKSFDTHGAYNTSTGTYTVPIGGKYRVSAVVEVSRTGGSFIVLNPFLNGVGTVSAGIIGSGVGIATISTVLNCLAGQTINLKIQADGTGQAYGSAYASSSISIERIGN
jgi:hypothetical protein